MTRLRVATWNLYLGADLALLFEVTDPAGLAAGVRVVRRQLEATRFAQRARVVARLLARERPHLVGLQEVARWAVAPVRPEGSLGPERVLEDFLPTLLAALARAGAGYDAHAVTENFSGSLPVSADEWMSVVGANVTLVRRDVAVRAERVAPYATGHEVVTGLNGMRFPVVRSWGLVDALVDGARVRVANTHTEAYDAGVRDAQRDELLAVLTDEPADEDGSVVLVGDLNATPDEVDVPAPWVDAWSRGNGPGATWGRTADLADPAAGLVRRIDYVWARGAEVLGCRLLGAEPGDRTPSGLWASDHVAVVADLEM